MHHFDLDVALAAWRRAYEYSPGLSAQSLDELEWHLRDHTAHLIAEGYAPEQAFRLAAQELGDYHTADTEYRKVERIRIRRHPIHHLLHTIDMLRHHLVLAVRTLRKNTLVASINIFGLALGLACALLVLLYAQDEWAYDAFHTNGDRIVRISTVLSDGVDESPVVTNGWPLGRVIAEESPDVAHMLYVRSWTPAFALGNTRTYHNLLYADQAFFEMFSFRLLDGDPTTALSAPYSVVLTENLADRYFGRLDVVGESIVLNDTLDFTVTGIVEDVPEHSHMRFEGLVSFATQLRFNPAMNDNVGWFSLQMTNYALLNPGVTPKAFESSVANTYMRHAAENFTKLGYEAQVAVEPLSDLYLDSAFGNGLGPQGSASSLLLMLAIGGFVALVAGVNYVNLMTAQSVQRSREVGVRKALGSDRNALRTQFLAEAIVTTLAAFGLSLVVIGMALGPFNLLVGKSLTLAELFTPLLLLSSLGLIVGGGVLAGLYPAFVLSSHHPVDVLKGQFVRSQEGQRLRKGLVVAQFTLSAVLMLGTLLVLNQRQHMEAQPLGFDHEQIIVVDAFRTPSQARLRQYEAVKANLLTSPAVEAVAVAQTMPGRPGWRGQIVQPEGRDLSEGLAVEYIPTDHDIVATLGLDIMAGRTFDRAFATDADDAVIINETAVRTFGWESPEKAVGKYLDSPSGHPRGRVVGVIRDFHQHGLQNSIAPVVFGVAPQYQRFVLVRVRPEQLQPALAQIEETWNAFYPGYPLQTSFLDDRFAEQYAQEAQLTRVFGTVGVLALLIACLGLFGLATFSAARRTKEIGVRKTLGASTVSLVHLLTRDVVVLVGIALAVAFPVAYVGMGHWLKSYAYAAPIPLTSFVVVGAVLLGVAIATVSYRAVRAATANPIESLRHE